MPRGRKAISKDFDEQIKSIETDIQELENKISDKKQFLKNLIKQKEDAEFQILKDAIASSGLSTEEAVRKIIGEDSEPEDIETPVVEKPSKNKSKQKDIVVPEEPKEEIAS